MNSPIETIVVTHDLVLDKDAVLSARIVVQASHIVIDGNGAVLQGPATPGDMDTFEGAGVAVLIDGCTNVTLKNLRACAFETGLEMRDCLACSVEDCDFSDNYDNKKFGWGELPARGGVICNGVKYTVFKNNKACNVWDGLHLRDSDDNLAMGNDFSHCSNVCAKLWNSSRNRFIENDLSYGIRIDRAAGEVHARDSTSILIESGSNDNFWYRNDVTNGGDGIFIRPLNGWLSTGNVFIENDTSYANNNCIEAWSPDNVYIRNKANHGSYGFWAAGSDKTLIIGNEASYNGLPDGYHNAPEPLFGHGGIVLVGSAATHVLMDGNRCAHNNGGGIVFRGDATSDDPKWRIRHWVVQRNVLEGNRWGIHGEAGEDVFLAGNQSIGNESPDSFDDVKRIVHGQGEGARPPKAVLRGPSRALVGVPVTFDASLSRDPVGGAPTFIWNLDGVEAQGPVLAYTFDRPGLHRVGLTVVNGAAADIAWLDVVVASGCSSEVGTELEAAKWQGSGIEFADDPDAIEGRFSLRFTALPTKDGLPWVSFCGEWNLSAANRIAFWFKALNTNVFCWQNEELHVKLAGKGGEFVYKPAKKNWLWGPLHNEARGNWLRVEIPIDGDQAWTREVVGNPDLADVKSFSLALDSTGEDPFTVWLHGLNFI